MTDTALGVLLFIATSESFLYLRLVESNRRLKLDADTLKEGLSKEMKLRETERSGRISVQKKIRQTEQILREENGYTYMPIARIESPFPDRRGTPRQPILVRAAKGKIRFNKNRIQREHFAELSQFTHIWVLFVFHENTSSHSIPSKIKPPRLGGAKVGCLSTRSPHRPNNIGISVCEIIGVGQDYIEIAGLDMVDGTPVIDVKPYIPYDAIPSDIPLPMARDANGETLLRTKLRVPEWIYESDIDMKVVRLEPVAAASLEDIAQSGCLRFCNSYLEAIELITQVLRQDIRGVHQGRGTTVGTGTGTGIEVDASLSSPPVPYMCRLDSMELEFITTDLEILVTKISRLESKKQVRTQEKIDEI